MKDHPLELNRQKIKEEGIVVFDNVKGLPAGREPFVSPDYVICIGHRGHIDLTFDSQPDVSGKYTIAVIFPNHSLCEVNKSDDYLATLIVLDSSLLNDPMVPIIEQLRYRYDLHPCIKLDQHEYRMIMNVVELMRETSRLSLPERRMLHLRQLEFLLRLLNLYRRNKLNEPGEDKRVSNQFHLHLSQHILQHRDVGFYAGLACLSSKYFSDIIKRETGHTPTYWIHARMVVEAKMLLHTRHDLALQAIADLLGFDNQASFCRYFRRETGLSPTQFRKKG